MPRHSLRRTASLLAVRVWSSMTTVQNKEFHSGLRPASLHVMVCRVQINYTCSADLTTCLWQRSLRLNALNGDMSCFRKIALLS